MEFCSLFDQALARSGPPAVFLPDVEGLWRFDESWTRDCWERSPGPHVHCWTFSLLRDRGTGFVQIVLATGSGLVHEHPRADVRTFDDLDAALAVRASIGPPYVDRTPW